jgi:hypothetical protein
MERGWAKNKILSAIARDADLRPHTGGPLPVVPAGTKAWRLPRKNPSAPAQSAKESERNAPAWPRNPPLGAHNLPNPPIIPPLWRLCIPILSCLLVGGLLVCFNVWEGERSSAQRHEHRKQKPGPCSGDLLWPRWGRRPRFRSRPFAPCCNIFKSPISQFYGSRRDVPRTVDCLP